MASRQEGGGRDFFLTFGGPTRSPFSRRGLAFVFLFVLFAVCVFVFLITYVCYWMGFSFCLFCSFCLSFVRLQDPGFEPGVSGTVVGFPVSLWSCVLLVLRLAVSSSFVLVALRRVVLVFESFTRVARLSCFFLWWVCVGGSAFLSCSA